jgi:hypothetical protein
MITTDQGFRHQQNATTLPLAVIVLVPATNDVDDLRPLVPQLLAELSQLQPNSIVVIGQP